jgi:hypothetical protein
VFEGGGEYEAAARSTSSDVEPKVEHDGVELEHLVEVAEERAVRGHSGGGPVKRQVLAVVAGGCVT